MKKVILASGDAGKLREIQTILAPLGRSAALGFSSLWQVGAGRAGLHPGYATFGL
jgi:hypothetical protein